MIVSYEDIIKSHFCLKNIVIQYEQENCLYNTYCEYSRKDCSSDMDCGTHGVRQSKDSCYDLPDLETLKNFKFQSK